MSKVIFLLSFFVVSYYGTAQTTSNRVVATYGSCFSDSNIIVSQTIGESSIQTFATDSFVLNQGFHQSENEFCTFSFSLPYFNDTIYSCGSYSTIQPQYEFDSIVWNTGDTTPIITANLSGWYVCTVMRGLCSAKDSVYIQITKQIPAPPTAISITALQTNVCGARKYRYSVPISQASSGYLWSFQGPLSSSMTIDSGTLQSRVFTVTFFSNAAASVNDSVFCSYTSVCGNSKRKAIKLSNIALNPPNSPINITITPITPYNCNLRQYRYVAPGLPSGGSTTTAATGWNWSFVGSLAEFATIDSGDINSQKILVSFSSNLQATLGDSVKLFYSSACGNSSIKSMRLTNTLLKVPASPSSITIQAIQSNLCNARRYRYIAPLLPAATTSTGAATGYVWSFIGNLSSSITIDSGSLSSRILTITLSSNEGAAIGDSVKLFYTSDCGNSNTKAIKQTILALNPPKPPSSILIQSIQTNVCGARKYRYIAPLLPPASTTTGAATGYVWEFIGNLSSSITIDSGTLNSKIIVVTFSSNAAAITGDSVSLYFQSACGNSSRKSMKLINTFLGAPLPPSSIIMQLKTDQCNARTYRYIAPLLPTATNSVGAANGYLWTAPFGNVGNTGILDSGTLDSRIINVTYSSNASASVGDSIKLRFTSNCGLSIPKVQKLSNISKSCTPISGIYKQLVDGIDFENQIKIYPNPNKGIFTITVVTGIGNKSNADIQLFDMKGRLINSFLAINENGKVQYLMSLDKPTAGVYLIACRVGNFYKSTKVRID